MSFKWPLMFVVLAIAGCGQGPSPNPANSDVATSDIASVGTSDISSGDDIAALHVHPGEQIQEALDKAAADPTINKVVVHSGTYRPPEPRQALIWLNKRHDGIHLIAKGEVTLTSANPDIANSLVASFPAVVNHVIYCGDGVGPDTKNRRL